MRLDVLLGEACTAALKAMSVARAAFFVSFVHCGATVQQLLRVLHEEPAVGGVTIACAGQEGRVALEDVVCAGRLVRLLTAARSTFVAGDGARIAALAERADEGAITTLAGDASPARALEQAGFAADVERCLTIDAVPLAVRCLGGLLKSVT